MKKYIKRGEPLTKPCVVCSQTMTRPYKMTLELWEKRKYCSQKCHGAARKGEKQDWQHREWTNEERRVQSEKMRGNAHALGYRFSEEQKNLLSEIRSNELHPLWKDDEASYSAIHKWLRRNYGNATKCENKQCLRTSSTFDYALISGRNHSHSRENYVMLCRQCHKIYDISNKVRIEL